MCISLQETIEGNMDDLIKGIEPDDIGDGSNETDLIKLTGEMLEETGAYINGGEL